LNRLRGTGGGGAALWAAAACRRRSAIPVLVHVSGAHGCVAAFQLASQQLGGRRFDLAAATPPTAAGRRRIQE
jgi:hypothetical protein